MNTTATADRHINAIPPRTPPIIAPRLLDVDVVFVSAVLEPDSLAEPTAVVEDDDVGVDVDDLVDVEGDVEVFAEVDEADVVDIDLEDDVVDEDGVNVGVTT